MMWVKGGQNKDHEHTVPAPGDIQILIISSYINFYFLLRSIEKVL